MAFGLEPDGSTQKSIRLPLLPLGLTSRVPLESALPRSLALQASPRTASILPWGSVALRRFQSRAATCTGLSTTRLSSALGVSHPLDALLRSKPSRPCFMPVTPLSFCLQRVSPPFDRFASRRSNPSCRFPATPTIASDLAVFTDVRRHSRGSKGVSHPVIRASSRARFPGTRRSILSWPLPLQGSLPSELDPVLPQDPLSWASVVHRRANPPSSYLLFKVSKNRR